MEQSIEAALVESSTLSLGKGRFAKGSLLGFVSLFLGFFGEFEK